MMRRRSRLLALLMSVVVATGVMTLTAPAAFAEGASSVSLVKDVSTPNVVPGETFSYDLTVGCTAIDVGTGCTNAVLVDPIPEGFDVVQVDVGDGLQAAAPKIDGNTVTVTFTEPLTLPAGAVGLKPSSTGVVTVTVRVRDDFPFARSGIPIVNTATLTASNGLAPAVDDATVTPTVTRTLHADAQKSFDPTGGAVSPGTAVTATLSGANTSNAGVDSLVLTDPIDPAAAPNPFQHLGVTGLGSVTFPDGADLVQVDVWDGFEWVSGTPAGLAELPSTVDPASISGLRFTFTNSTGAQLPQGATATIPVSLTQRETVSAITGPTTIVNELTATVTNGADSASDADPANYVITPTVVGVGTSKSFDPKGIVAGDSSTVTTSVTNDSENAVASLTLTEPAVADAADPLDSGIPVGIDFDAFTNVMWPNGATAASVTWTYRDGTTETVAAGSTDTLPAPDPAREVARFSATFTGAIESGAEARIPFTVVSRPNVTPTPLVWDNTIEGRAVATDGTIGTSTSKDTLTVYDEHLAVKLDKKISPSAILSIPGQPVTVQLPAQLLPFPDPAVDAPGSTTDARQIVVQDPQTLPVVPGPDTWWNSFNAMSITQTAIPAGSTLTVQYWNGTTFIDLPGAVGIAGSKVFSMNIPAGLRDQIQGLKFTFDSSIGFAPGTKVQPNFGAALRPGHRDDGSAIGGPKGDPANLIENCASAGASAPNIDPASAVTAAPCPTIELVPTLPGTGDLIDKTWLESGEATGKTVIARSGDVLPARITWSTGGYGNLDTVVVSDTADVTKPVAETVFNAFDLTGIHAISQADDPWLKYDQILRVELYNGTDWVTAKNDPCPGACDGTFPGLKLTGAEQTSTTGVRLVYAESPTRAATIGDDPTAPQVGSGVSRSIGNDRSIVLDFAVRDLVRVPVTNPDPATGSRLYNADRPGDVVNTARATGFDAAGAQVVTDEAADTAAIIDVPLNVQVTKEWSGGPLGIPPLGTDAAYFPSGRVSITGTNVTAARVDGLTVSDPAPDSTTKPFDVFNVKRIVSITVPAGATGTSVTLTKADGTTEAITREQALGLAESALTEVIGITVAHTGRIESNATTTVTFDTRLRATVRGTDERVSAASFPTVPNDARALVTDLGGNADDNPIATKDASITLAEANISVVAGKSFNVASQQEPNRAPVAMTLSGRPGGSVRTTTMVLTDDAGTFWNAFDVAGLAGQLTLTAPINRVQADVCVDRDFTDVTLGCEASGGHWVLGSPLTASQFNSKPLPDGVNAADVEGVRFTFTRADGAFWENPANPLQQVPLSVQRRTELRSGGEVPSTLAGNQPAPGETVAGTFTNTVVADVTGALNGGEGTPPLTATNSKTAQIQYVHSLNSVVVQKTPTGVQPPGRVFTYGLTITNNGNTPIINPVVTDRLPRDAGGPQLIFDPAADPASSPFSYAVTGAPPLQPNGTQLPTSVADVTATVNSAADGIRFSFPTGSVLEVGQSYKISVQLMFRPGLTANTRVTNSMGVVADREWDACSGTLDPATGECVTSTTVTVQLAGAIRGIKSVKAVDDELGINFVGGQKLCVPDDAGFFTGGCVPITKPGGLEVWRNTFTNTGTLPMNRFVAIDKLPALGDTGASTPLPRGSQFTPTFEGTVALAGAPAGSVLTTYYTTAAAPCTADLNTTGSGCAAGSWAIWDPAAGIDPATVKGLKFVVDFATPIQPAGVVKIDLTTKTPAYSPTAGTNTVAWNTIAVAGRTVNGTTLGTTPTTEGNKVGVSLATGPLQAVKELTGAGADRYAPASYTGHVTCVSAGEDIPPVPITLLGDGTPTTVPNLPWGAECTISEDDNGQTSETANTVTIVSEEQTVPVVILTNVYSLAGLELTKRVVSGAVDASGTPVSYGPFDVAVSCTFLGKDVYADGFSAEDPMALTLADGESVTLTGLPARAACTITETDAKGAVSTSITTTGTDTGGEPELDKLAAPAPAPAAVVDGTVASIQLAADDEDGDATNGAVIENRFADGSVEIAKTLTGDGAEAWGAGPFTVHATCTLTDPSGTRIVWDGDVVLGGEASLTATIEHIAADATCEVTETKTGGADGSTVTPGTVTVGDGTTAEVSVVNEFLLGALHVQKTIDGEGAELYGAGPFQVALSCVRDIDGESVAFDVPGGATRALTAENGYAADYEGLPARAECRILESETGGATTSVISSGDGENAVTGIGTDGIDLAVAAGDTVTVSLTNTFAVGSITVTKQIIGLGAGDNADKTFTVLLTCAADIDGERVSVAVPGGGERKLSKADGLTATFEQLPVGAECELVETAKGGAARTTITPNAGDAQVGSVTVASGEAVAITVVNDFDPTPIPPKSGGLTSTGVDAMLPWTLGGGLAALGALLLGVALWLRRRSASA
ncbi:DUF5979 domain-containing protein [Plantibacter sp. YIM 135347]|uniref:DUF5979 domain-containing protein n=1 Tax=Plantibacter sp. YIM 135347 TaxID=3423919 RepID=UPI003D328124